MAATGHPLSVTVLSGGVIVAMTPQANVSEKVDRWEARGVGVFQGSRHVGIVPARERSERFGAWVLRV